MKKPIQKQEVRRSIREIRGFLRLAEVAVRDGDWSELEVWMSSVEGEAGIVAETLKRF